MSSFLYISIRLLHSQTDYIEPLDLFALVHNFVAWNSIVRTRPQNHAWGHCGETSTYKTNHRPWLYPCLNEWDVLMWSLRLCNRLEQAIPYKITWLYRLTNANWKLQHWNCWAGPIVGSITTLKFIQYNHGICYIWSYNHDFMGQHMAHE